MNRSKYECRFSHEGSDAWKLYSAPDMTHAAETHAEEWHQYSDSRKPDTFSVEVRPADTKYPVVKFEVTAEAEWRYDAMEIRS